MGYGNRPPDADELKAMRREVALAMEQGAFGLSSGLTLYPSSVARAGELVEDKGDVIDINSGCPACQEAV